MDKLDYIRATFARSIQSKQRAQDTIAEAVAHAATMMADALASDHKILACGNGGSAADAQHFAAELVNRFESERRALAAVALTTDSSILTSVANDYDYAAVFARQIEALGCRGDLLLAISTSGHSQNVNAAVRSAHSKGMHVIALSGKDGGSLGTLLNQHDIEIRVPSNSTARIQENHLVVIHCLCGIIEQSL